jgi:hypothetical protein
MTTAAYLWSIHDLLAYGIFFGWCVHGRRYVISIVIDVFFLQTTPLGSKEMLSERILLWKRDL